MGASVGEQRLCAKAREIRPVVEAETGGAMRAVEQYEVLFFDLRPQNGNAV
jgi:hypothetical protein